MRSCIPESVDARPPDSEKLPGPPADVRSELWEPSNSAENCLSLPEAIPFSPIFRPGGNLFTLAQLGRQVCPEIHCHQINRTQLVKTELHDQQEVMGKFFFFLEKILNQSIIVFHFNKLMLLRITVCDE